MRITLDENPSTPKSQTKIQDLVKKKLCLDTIFRLVRKSWVRGIDGMRFGATIHDNRGRGLIIIVVLLSRFLSVFVCAPNLRHRPSGFVKCH